MSKPEYVDEFIHACHVTDLDDKTDAVVVKVHRHHTDGTVTPELVTIKQPARPFYLTKPAYRNHEFKKEWELLSNLDRYQVPNCRLGEELDAALSGRRFSGGFKRRVSVRQLCNSPYVYGADMEIECLVKHKYQKTFEASGLKNTRLTTGFFDIETDVVTGNGNEPTIISVTHENKVYTAIQRKFFTVRQPDGQFRPGDLAEFIQFSKRTLDQHIDELLTAHMLKNPKSNLKRRVAETPFEYFYFVGDSAEELVAWIFIQIHKNSTDFLGIWNLDFDIPKIIGTLERAGVSLKSVLCPPSLPERYRFVNYQRDEKETADIYKKWHWLHNASGSQFIDSMCLYRILRTVKGMESSMSLDNVLKLNDLGGKLTFKDDSPDTEDLSPMDWHRHMQKNEAYKYIVYNQFDCISIQLMEWKNDDIGSMVILGGVSRLCKWNRQTRKVSDALYFDALDAGMVTASPGTTMETAFDLMIGKVGGAVLRPERTINVGLKIFSDKPDITTMLHNMVGDVDFTAMYPTATDVCNISKETKLSASLNIDGMDAVATQTYYSLIVSLQENAVLIGGLYYNLPGYEEMQARLDKSLQAQPAYAKAA